MSHNYQSYSALIRTVKDRAKSQGMLSSRTEKDFRFSRLLYRIFTYAPEDFVLKGGQSMLARIPDARTTRDIDFSLSKDKGLREGISLLREVVSMTGHDFLQFEYVKEEEISGQDISLAYSGRRIHFDVIADEVKVDSVQVDLVAGTIITDMPTLSTPQNQITVPGLPVVDYLLYPVVDQIADKLCAIFETHHSGSSSRIRDLADLVLISKNEVFDAVKLIHAIDSECRRRKMEQPTSFVIPKTWTSFGRVIRPHSAADFPSVEESVELVGTMLNPILSGEIACGAWSPDSLKWTDSALSKFIDKLNKRYA